MSEVPIAKSPGELAMWHDQLPDDAHPGVLPGTFDFLHPGSLATLRDAAARVTHLVVLLEDDGSAASHSGAGRPFHTVDQRAEFLQQLRSVSAIAIVTDSTVGDFLNATAPLSGVVCLEADGALDARIPAYVSQMHYVPLVPGLRTNDVVAAIKGGHTPIASTEVLASPARTPLDATVKVSVNGCFDILHNGHLDMLTRAKAMGDHLTVLINSDLSVQRYKGETRPVFSQTFRKQALLELCSVDAVEIFHEDNPLNLLNELRPDIHVKGGSYEAERVAAETELLSTWGGKIEFCPLLEGFSTSAIIEMAQ